MHICFRINVTDIQAVLGEHDRESKTDTVTVEKKLVGAKVYANFSILTFNNDIAVLELESPAELGTIIRPACLPSDGESSPVNECAEKQPKERNCMCNARQPITSRVVTTC
jgi:hypothetical protein